ncbi:MAG TPA: hypothetical protein VN256_26685 [Pyrinomonadaceae bacterium]|nr:hypothetical protein [Pyrinomonadaceae bacterium]
MKAVTTKMLVSLVGVLLAAPFFVVALVVGARAVALSQGSHDDLLLAALALCGAAISIANGMGRRAARDGNVASGRTEASGGAARCLRDSSRLLIFLSARRARGKRA